MGPIWCIRFLHMATLVCADSSCSQQTITQNALKPMIPIIVWLQHRRHPDQQRDVENWNIMRINTKKKKMWCFFKCGQAQRTACSWEQMLKEVACICFPLPSPRPWGKNTNFKPVNGGTVILTWPASCARALRRAARHQHRCPDWAGK